MKSNLHSAAVLLTVLLFSFTSWSQSSTVSGNVKNAANQQGLPAVSITVKGTSQGTFTDEYGNFKLTVTTLPVTLVLSSIGFETKEVSVDNATSAISIEVVPTSTLG